MKPDQDMSTMRPQGKLEKELFRSGFHKTLTWRVHNGLILLRAPAGNVLCPLVRALHGRHGWEQLLADSQVLTIMRQPNRGLLVAPAQLTCCHLQNPIPALNPHWTQLPCFTLSPASGR